MRIFSREVSTKKSNVAHNPARTLKQLNFLNFLNPRNESALVRVFEDPALKGAFLDSAAALVAQLAYRQYLTHKSVLKDAFEFFEARIQTSGYKLIASSSDLSAIAENQRVEMLVAGSQTRAIIDARVDAALAFIQSVRPRKVKVTFSGANPAQGVGGAETMQGIAHIIDEAAEMRSYFVDRKHKAKNLKGIEIEDAEESASKNTQENIRNYFKDLKLEAGAKNHVVIVSSTFHLPRFISLTDAYLADSTAPLDRLTFVGAENIREPNCAMASQNYVKSAMFEFFSYLHEVKDVRELMGSNERG